MFGLKKDQFETMLKKDYEKKKSSMYQPQSPFTIDQSSDISGPRGIGFEHHTPFTKMEDQMMSTKNEETFPNFSEQYNQLKNRSHINRAGDQPARDI
jgi:hypothetical protein